MKSGGGLLDDGQPLVRPAHSQELHYEGELVVLIGEGGFQISKESAASHVWGYAPGIDFTLRDVQWRVRDQGRPWFPAKCFRGSAAIGPFKAASEVGDVSARRLRLLVNGLPRQDSLISAMNNDVASLVHLISADLPLLRGDAIFTGTPNGVGPCLPGDSVECQIEEVGSVRVKIVA